MAYINNVERLDLADVSSIGQLAQRRALAREAGPTTQQVTLGRGFGAILDWIGDPDFDSVRPPLHTLEKMRFDTMIAIALAYAKMPLMRASWYISSERADVAAFVDNALRQIYGRFVLGYTNDLDYGFSPGVQLYSLDRPDWVYFDQDAKRKKPAWGKNIDALVWKPFLWLNPRRVRIHFTQDGAYGGIDYGAPSMAPATNTRPPDIPPKKTIWATNDRDRLHGDLYGYPRIGHARRYWWDYWYHFALCTRAAERIADPPVIVYYPQTDPNQVGGGDVAQQNKATAQAAGEGIKSGATVTIPNALVMDPLGDTRAVMRAWEITQMEASNTDFAWFLEKFRYLDILKLRSIFIPEHALVEGQGGTSSRNVAAVHGDLALEISAQKMNEIADALNRYVIPTLVQANFGPDATATFVPSGFDPQDLDTIRTLLDRALQDPNEAGKLPIDFERSLEAAGVPILSPAQQAERLKDAAEAQKNSQPPPVRPGQQQAGGAGVRPVPPTAGTATGNVPVRPANLYYDAPGSLNLSEWPSTLHYSKTKPQATELRQLWLDAYRSMYESFARFIAENDLPLELADEPPEREKLAASTAASRLVTAWQWSSDAARTLWDATRELLFGIMSVGARHELESHNLSQENWSIDNEDVRLWMAEHGAALVRDVTDTVREEIRTFLAREMLQNKDPNAIADAVREHFSDFPDWKATRLARTETATAYNVSSLLGYKSARVAFVQAIDGRGGITHRTDTPCTDRDGRVFPIDHAMREPLLHPNCTLAWRPILEPALQLAEGEEFSWDENTFTLTQPPDDHLGAPGWLVEWGNERSVEEEI